MRYVKESFTQGGSKLTCGVCGDCEWFYDHRESKQDEMAAWEAQHRHTDGEALTAALEVLKEIRDEACSCSMDYALHDGPDPDCECSVGRTAREFLDHIDAEAPEPPPDPTPDPPPLRQSPTHGPDFGVGRIDPNWRRR